MASKVSTETRIKLQGNADEAAHFGQALRRDAGPANRVGHPLGDAPHQDTVALGKRKRQFARLFGVLQFRVHWGGGVLEGGWVPEGGAACES